MRLTLAFATLLLAALPGCSHKIVRVDMDTARLAAPVAHDAPLGLLCDYRLGDVVDARAAGAQAGGLSANVFTFTDAAAVVRKQLLRAGLSEDPASHGSPVTVRIVQLYLAQNLETKIPVAVYRVSIGNEPAFVLRSQKASMNWNGTQNEAYAAYALAMSDATRQLVIQLNRRCPGDSTPIHAPATTASSESHPARRGPSPAG